YLLFHRSAVGIRDQRVQRRFNATVRTRARAFVLATVGRSVHVPNDLSTELFRGCFRSSYSRCYFSIWFQCFDLGHAAVTLSDINRLDFARVLVKGDVRILQDLAVLMSLRPIQR